MMKISIKMLGAVLAIFIVGGCVTSAPIEIREFGPVYDVRSSSMMLNNTIRLKTSNLVQNKNGFYKAQIEVANLENEDIQAQYRFRWLDESQMRVGSSEDMWLPCSVGAKSTVYVSSTAPNTRATGFIMEVRFPHKSTRW